MFQFQRQTGPPVSPQVSKLDHELLFDTGVQKELVVEFNSDPTIEKRSVRGACLLG